MDDLLSGSRSGGLGFFFGFSPGDRHGESKVFMHRLLEQNAAPTLWTTNLTSEIDPSILRRMMFAMELRMPPPKVRARIWARQLSRHGIEAGESDALALATEFDATPGVAAGATAAAKISGGDLDTVRHGVRNLSRVLSCEKPSQRPPDKFDPTFIQADKDLIRLADRLTKKDERRFSLCLQGPPGTGKSAFVRYLAERLGLGIMQMRASHLLSMWVGQTEKNIAKAFADAYDQEAFLVFDEADSLLADRQMAQRTWEISHVNEMLTWMESHRFPFACTTNFVEKLDPATLRRFTFKVKLGYLTTEQASAVQGVLQPHAPKGTRGSPGTDSRRFRRCPQGGRGAGPPARCTFHRRHVAHRVQSQARPDEKEWLSALITPPLRGESGRQEPALSLSKGRSPQANRWGE